MTIPPARGAQLDALMADVIMAARVLRAGSAEAAVDRLLPSLLAEDELQPRVRHLLRAARVVAMELLGPAMVRDPAAADPTGALDQLVRLVRLLAWLGPRDG